MTMLSVISVPEGIVLSADSCVNSNPQNIQDKIFIIPQNNIGFMVYENASLLKRLTEQYQYDKYETLKQQGCAKLEVTEFCKKLIRTYKNKPEQFYGVGDKSGYVGVVSAGYENDKPTVATFVVGSRPKYLPQGSKKDKYRLMNPGTQTVDMKEEEECNTPIHIFTDYFGICFATTEYAYKHVRDKNDFANMSIKDAIDYSRKLIGHTISEISKEIEANEITEQNVYGPIDTLVIPRVGEPYWKYTPKVVNKK